MTTAATTKPTVAELLQKISDRQDAIEQRVEKALATPAHAGAQILGAPNYVRSGVRDSAPYSMIKAVGLSLGFIQPEDAKEELHVHNQLHTLYKQLGWSQAHEKGRVLLIPYSLQCMPMANGGDKLRVEIRQKMAASLAGYDPDEVEWVNQRHGLKVKALGTTSDIAGGSLVGFPTVGELVDLQRNMEVFSRAGATQIGLPANARLMLPKLTGGSTAYWVGEGAAITASDPSTGDLDLIGKKLGVLVKINNELIRYATPSVEGMVRTDMAAQAALKADLAMLEGTGGTQIKGLITYDSASSWTQGQDKLLTYTVTSNIFQPEDVYGMQGVMPDMVQAYKKSFVMRNDLWGKIRGRRADAVSAADGKGPFVFNITRTGSDNIPPQLDGYDVVGSSQVSNTRSTNKSYVLCGAFQDWVVARYGIMELKMSDTGDTAFTNDQTWMRAIQIIDAGPRHASSFVFADNVNIA